MAANTDFFNSLKEEKKRELKEMKRDRKEEVARASKEERQNTKKLTKFRHIYEEKERELKEMEQNLKEEEERASKERRQNTENLTELRHIHEEKERELKEMEQNLKEEEERASKERRQNTENLTELQHAYEKKKRELKETKLKLKEENQKLYEKMLESLKEKEKLKQECAENIQNLTEEKANFQKQGEDLKEEIRHTKETAVKDHNKLLNEMKAAGIIKTALIGAAAGAAGGIIIAGTAGLGTPAAIAVTGSLAAAGGLTGAAIGLTLEFLQRLESIKPEDRANFFKEHPAQTSLFCFSAGIALCCAALYELGEYAYGTFKPKLKEELAKANGIDLNDIEKNEKFSKFAEEIYSISKYYQENPNKLHSILQDIEKASSDTKIYGAAITRLSLKFFENALWMKKSLKSIDDNIYKLSRTKSKLDEYIAEESKFLEKSQQSFSVLQSDSTPSM